MTNTAFACPAATTHVQLRPTVDMKHLITWLYFKYVVTPDMQKRMRDIGMQDGDYAIKFIPHDQFMAQVEASHSTKH